MRAVFLFLAVVIVGCAGSRDSQRPARSSGIPVVRETPRLSERRIAIPQRESRSDSQAMVEVSGNLTL